MERRTNKRQPVKATLLFANKLPARTLDFGPEGACVEMASVFLPGSRVHGTVQLGKRTLPFEGEVVWAEPGDWRRRNLSRFGVRFLGEGHV